MHEQKVSVPYTSMAKISNSHASVMALGSKRSNALLLFARLN
jgi:hypothetical protein